MKFSKNMDSIIQPVSTFATVNQVESKPDKLDKVGAKLCAHNKKRGGEGRWWERRMGPKMRERKIHVIIIA